MSSLLTHSQVVIVVGVAWALIATALFAAVGTISFLGLAILSVGGLVPPLVYAALSGGPPATIAEILHDTEQERPVR